MYIKIAYILFFLASAIEPLIWLYAFGMKFRKKYNRLLPYMAYVFVDYATAILRQFTSKNIKSSELVFTIFMIVYVIYFINKLYEGKITDKIVHVGLMFIISLASDFLSIGAFVLMGRTVQELSSFGIPNMLATIVSKVFLVLIISIVFKQKRKVDSIAIPVIFSTLLLELPCIELFNRMSLIENSDYFLLMYVFGQIGLLLLVMHVTYLLQKQRNREEELKKWTRDMQMQLEGAAAAGETFENLRMLRHDIKFHIGTIKTLMSQKKYEEAESYLNNAYKDIDISEKYFTLKNRNVSITLDRLKQKARENGVNFYTKIMTEEFIIDDVDICTILLNIVMNAIEASRMSEEKYIKLVISNQEGGYQIECTNPYIGNLDIRKGKYKTTKGNGRGLGIEIVRKAVKNNRGKASFIGKDGLFKVSVFIPGE